MFKLFVFFSILFIYSCDSKNIQENTVTSKNEDVIQNSNSNFLNIEKIKELRERFKNNNKNVFTQGYFDDDNNAMIFFDKIYIVNKKSELKIVEDNAYFSSPILDKNGNGMSVYSNSNIGDGTEPVLIKKFENFIPTESLITNDKQNLFNINKPTYFNYIGEGYSFFNNDNRELIFFDINGFFKYTEKSIFDLENNEKFQSIILNDRKSGLIFTKEESFDHIYTHKVYFITNNSIDLKKGIVLKNLTSNFERYISGKIDRAGNGYIAYNDKENNIELRKIFSYTIEENITFYNNMKFCSVNLNAKGNGFATTIENNSIFFTEIKNYRIRDNKIIISNELDKIVLGLPIYLINDEGNGFILLSSYKYIHNPYLSESKENETTFNNNIIFVKDYKIVKD